MITIASPKNLFSLAVLSLCSIGAVSGQNSILVNTGSITLSSNAGNAQPVSQSITVSSNNAPFTFQIAASVNNPAGVNWLSVDRNTATTPALIIVSANAAALPNGTYTGNVQIVSSAANNTPVNIPVTFVVGASGSTTLQAAPASVIFDYMLGGAAPPSQTLSVTSPSGALGFTASASLTTGAGWLEVSPTSGTTPMNVILTVPPAVVASGAPGTYTGFVILTPSAGGGAPLQVPVTLNIGGAPRFTASPASVVFNYQTGQANPPQQSISLAVLGGSANFSIAATTTSGGNWLVVTPALGVTPAVLNVGVQQPSFLQQGTYSGNIRVTSFSGQPAALDIPVTLNVSSNPLLTVTPNSLQFSYQPGGALPPAQAVTPSTTSGSVNYSVTAQANGGNWLIVNPASGATPTPFSVSVNPAGLAPGSYTGTVTVLGIGTGNPAQNVPVTLTVTNSPILTASTSSLTFNFQLGRTPPVAQIVNVNSTGGPFNYTITSETITGAGYLNVSATGGTTPGSFSVGMNSSVLSQGAPGIYQARVIITAPGAANSPLIIPITLNLSDQALVDVSPATLSFSYQGSGALPSAQLLALTSTGDSATFTVTSSSAGGWLTVGPSAGSTPANVTVQVNPLGLLAGTYNGSITIATAIPNGGATLNSPITVPVTLVISAGTLAVAPASLSFQQAQAGNAPPAQTINVTSSGNSLNYSAIASSSVGNWLSVTPANASTPGALTVSVNGAGLAPGTYNGTVTVTAVGASNSPLNIPVTVTIGPSQTLSVTPTTLSFTAQLGGTAPATQSVALSSATPLNFTTAISTSNTGAWLTATPASGATNATLTVGVNPSGLTAGTYSGTITVTAPGAGNSPQTINVTLTVITVPMPAPTGVVNAASFAPGPIAPGEILTIGGSNLGPAAPQSFTVNSLGFVDPVLAETRVLFDNIPGIVYYTSQNQINVIAPYGIFGRPTVRMTVSYRNQVSNAIELRVAETAPGVFGIPNSTQGAILNQNLSVNGASNPAARNSVITLYATGEGQTTPAGQDGRVIPLDASQLKRPLASVTATIGGVPATVEYAGSAPGLVSGVLQVNLRVNENTPTGNQAVVLTVGGTPSQANLTAAIN